MPGDFIPAQQGSFDKSMPQLTANKISYSYPGSQTTAFRDVSFHVDQGEVLQIEGRNGSGKTTLLKVVSGILNPDSGSVSVENDRMVVYMNQFSEKSMSPDLTVREHVAAFSRQPDDWFPNMVKSFGLGLEHRGNEFVGHLSGGQRQVLALLCAISIDPAIMCLDEFSSSMDTRSTAVAESILEDHLERNDVSLIVVSHRFVQNLANIRTIVLGDEGSEKQI